MRKRRSVLLTVLPLLVLGGLVYAGAHLQASRHAGTFICPLTGQELPCPRCCPLNSQSRVRHDGHSRPAAGVGLTTD